jgi:hypothetical protein
MLPYKKKTNNDDTDDDDNNDFNFQRHLLYINVDCLWPMLNLAIAVVVILKTGRWCSPGTPVYAITNQSYELTTKYYIWPII